MKKSLPLTALTLGLLLSACNTATTPPPTAPEPVTTLSGHVAQGSGAGSVKLNTPAGVTLTQGNLDASGNFSIDLPTADKLSGELVTADQALSKVGCSGTLNSSVPAAQGFGVASLALTRGPLSDDILPMSVNVTSFLGIPMSANADGRVWLYTDQPTTLTGTVDCTKIVNAGVPISIAVNVTTAKGWNMLRLTGGTSGTPPNVRVNGQLTNTSAAWTEWKTLTELKSTLTF